MPERKRKPKKGQGTYPKGLVRLNRREHKGIRGLKGEGLLVKGYKWLDKEHPPACVLAEITKKAFESKGSDLA